MSESLASERPVSIDNVAARKLQEVIEQKGGGLETMLRLAVVGGGCTGFQYRLGLDEDLNDGDFVFESNAAKIVVDAVSYSFVAGSVITYRDDLTEAGFQVDNPNVHSSCGCGSSFSVDPKVAERYTRQDDPPGASPCHR